MGIGVERGKETGIKREKGVLMRSTKTKRSIKRGIEIRGRREKRGKERRSVNVNGQRRKRTERRRENERG
ncbi:hypothetical protein L2E82_41557 [Cichorium intybus]|uniref:Uncharacterized protein n=1 Tax=Cichorium intybus TaxID=13427 RepID=A0ACB9ANE9_CICIN|nr:hypothetical protein L2E82_41557 [Cichorium intybus]